MGLLWKDLHLCHKIPDADSDDSNVLILNERSYSRVELSETLDRDVPKMTHEQSKIYDEILDAVNERRGGDVLCLWFRWY